MGRSHELGRVRNTVNLSEPFIRRPVATSLLALAILLAGSAAYQLLPVSPLPRVDFPTLNVTGSLPGASPETMAASVATPLERRFGRIAGLSELTSTSALGATSLTLQFDLDRDVDAAARDVQAAINAAGGELPPNLPMLPTYQKVNASDAPILILSLTSETIPLGQVYDAANTILAQKFSQVDGVGQVWVSGGQQPAVRVQADPAVLAGLNLSLEDLRAALAAATVDEPEGSFTGKLQTASISANDQLFGADLYRDLVVAYRGGSAVRLSDVADVVDGPENNRLAAWSDGKRSILMGIRRAPGANIMETTERVKALLPQLITSISPAIHVNVVLDRTTTIRASIRDVELTLLITVALVVLVVFLFLRRAWATAIPSIVVPLSLVGTFGAMYLLDYSIDNLSLMALTISTGFVVDDAIVMIENITRFIEAGDTPLEAALKGSRQIGFTIVSITVSLVAVFFPILLMGGIYGRLFREFAVTLTVAICVSAVVSLTLTPMLSARFLRSHVGQREGRVGRALERFFAGLLRGYERSLRVVLRHQRLSLLVTLATVALTVWLYVIVPKGIFPQQDTGLLAGFSEAPQDVSFAAMSDLQRAADAVVRADPAVAHVNSFIGSANGTAGNTGFLFVALKPLSERKLSVDQVIARLRPQLARVDGITVYLQAVQDVRVGGRPSRTQYQYTLEDPDLSELNRWGPRLLERMKKIPVLRDVATDQQIAGLVASLAIDRDTAARLGVTTQALDDTLYDAFGQRQVATIYTELNQYRVILEVKPELQQDLRALDQLYVPSTLGGQVPLSAITSAQTLPTMLAVSHQGQFPAITLSFNLAPGVALGDAVKAIDAAEAEIGLPGTVHASFQGTAQAFQTLLKSEPWLILAALVTVYIVLGVLYESLVHPLTILSTLPSAGVGALLLLLATRTEFSLIALIGIVLLMGIVKKNAIMMVDFAIEAERLEGLTPEASIYKACVLRFRPITMTTLAALFGALPLALGTGTGSELRRPLGIAIVGGLVVSQLLTLFTTPVVYLYLDRFRLAVSRWGQTRRVRSMRTVDRS